MISNYSRIENEHFIKSAALHIGLVVLAIVIHKLPAWTKSNSKTIIIKESVRVDVIGMPKYTVQELKKMQLPDLSTEVVEEAPKPVVDKNDSKVELKKVGKVNLGNLLKGISKRTIKPKKRNKKKKNTVGVRNLRKLVLEGNKLSKGTALTGDIKANGDLTAYENYAASVAPHVRKFWKLPSYLLEEDLKCRVKVYVNESGRVISQRLLSSSGNKEFDSRALKAVKLSSPLPIPEQGIVKNVKVNGIVLAFPIL